MYVKGPDNALLNLNNAVSAKLRGGWQVGQLLKALVVSTDRQGGAMLEINGQRLQAQHQASMPLRTGQALQLEVVRSGDSPVLKVLNPPATQQEVVIRGVRQSLPQQQPLPKLLNTLNQLAQSTQGETGQPLRALSQQILNQLPQLQQLNTGPVVKQAIQDSGSFLEAKLQQRSQQAPGGKADAALNRDLKAGVLRLLQLLRSMPQPQQAGRGQPVSLPAQTGTLPSASPGAQIPLASSQTSQAAQVTQAPPPLGESQALPTPSQVAAQTNKTGGETHSKRMAYSTNQPPQPQAQATQVAQAISQVGLQLGGGETQQQLESGLARIQFNQLQSIQQSESQQRPSWFLELPIRQADGQINTLQLQIQRDREGNGTAQHPPIWTTSVSFELQSLGPIRAGLTLVGDKQIGVSLWADEEETVELFAAHKEVLERNMRDAGLIVSRVGCQQGLPPSLKTETVFADKGLVDERA
jgi:hypothetical protein